MRKNVLVDIDHTLSNAFWRDSMIGSMGWDDYHMASRDDQPLQDMCSLINELWFDYQVIGLTARPEKWRKLTVEWLLKNRVELHEILMRPDDDYRSSPELKVALAKKRFGDDLHNHVSFVIDDRDDVCSVFRALGVTVLQCYARAT